MALYETIRFYPRSDLLKPLIKYFWVFESRGEVELNHTILPVSNIDLIFNLCTPSVYEKQGKIHTPPGDAFFSGLRSEPITMKQSGRIFTMGAAFFPAGFFPFSGIPVSEFKDMTLGLDDIVPGQTQWLFQALHQAGSIKEKIDVLEHFFLTLVSKNLDRKRRVPGDARRLMNSFGTENTGVKAFCNNHGVHPRTLERMFNRYIGTSPKGYLRLSRFQSTLNHLLKADQVPLTRLAQDLEFYDQPHFIRDFKAFTGASPSRFLKEKKAIIQLSRPHLKNSVIP
ncbi:MAG: helix-turn-helix domain-containing protein [Desulfobacterales bacterium]|nr:helix-turn-helix domain-containing protein [Desulfobacterales bacterium]